MAIPLWAHYSKELNMKRNHFLFILGFASLGFITLTGIIGRLTDAAAQTAQKQTSEHDHAISAYAQRMITDGRHIFRFDTFGSEAFWGDALQLHKAIAGAKNG